MYREYANMVGLKLYAVSSGDGNDGVSHIFPDYYVWTSEPYRLATLALIGQFKEPYQQRALDECELDGEADYTISATLLEPLDDDSEDHECDEDCEDPCQLAVDNMFSYCDANGAYMIVEVFQDGGPDMSNSWHKPVYDSIEDCFSDSELALVPSESL